MLQQSEHEAECASALCEDDLVSCWYPEAVIEIENVATWRRMQAADLRWLGKLSVYTELAPWVPPPKASRSIASTPAVSFDN